MAQWYFFLISWQVSDKTLVSSVTSSPELFFVFLFFELHVVLIIKKKKCTSAAVVVLKALITLITQLT